jgi:tripartite-type tricarboxylate transporter receptor subunit TctC
MYQVALAVGGIALVGATSQANAAGEAEEFYKGKVVTYIVSTGTGGGADYYGRLTTRHMQRYLPGSTFIVRNVPGAGHIIGANKIYTSKPDGLTIGSFTTGLIYTQLVGRKGVRFDLAKMTWIGKGATDIRVLYMSAGSGIKTFDQLLKVKREIKFGASGVGASSYNEGYMISHAWNIPIRMILGYSGAERVMGMLRGEIEGQPGGLSSMTELTTADPGVVVLQFGKALPNVPDANDVAKTVIAKSVAKFMTGQSYLSRFLAGPPEMHKERTEVLRATYRKAFESKELREEAKKAHRPIEPLYGDDVTRMVKGTMDQPPELIALLTKITKLKVPMVKTTGLVKTVVRGGRGLVVEKQGKDLKVKISNSRTAIVVNGKKAKRGALKTGMNCAITWPKVNGEAKEVNCNGK